jgi:SAM-dependent methyltransferase
MSLRPNPRHDTRFLKYQAILLSKIDSKTEKGLEIGAFDLPFVTREMGMVEFADYLSTAELKDKAARTPGHSVDFVETVDYSLARTPLRRLPSDYRWVAAAHVAEHAPDLIGWFNVIGDRLCEDGFLFCVVPDARYTFDLNRPLSSLGKIIEDHADAREVPTFRDVFDAFYYFQPVSSAHVWQGDVVADIRFHNDFDWAWSQAAKTYESYVDAHCNTFIPESFAEIVSAVSRKGLIPFELEEIGDTDPGGIDFYAILRKRQSRLAQPVKISGIVSAENRAGSRQADSIGQAQAQVRTTDSPVASKKFELRAPSDQNAIDIFEGKWASDFAEVFPDLRAGQTSLFNADRRPRDAARLLGVEGRLDGMRVLELGPLEGAHTYQLEKLGAASVLAIEANAEAFLKCLIMKEITGLRTAKFMHGDFFKYLSTADESFDLAFCCGVLYHMSDPIALIESISKVTDKCFVWTHYYDQAHYPWAPRELRSDPRYPGVKIYGVEYNDMGCGQFWGGNQTTAVWLEREDILLTFRRAGFSRIDLVDETPDNPNGACFSFAAQR